MTTERGLNNIRFSQLGRRGVQGEGVQADLAPAPGLYLLADNHLPLASSPGSETEALAPFLSSPGD